MLKKKFSVFLTEPEQELLTKLRIHLSKETTDIPTQSDILRKGLEKLAISEEIIVKESE